MGSLQAKVCVAIQMMVLFGSGLCSGETILRGRPNFAQGGHTYYYADATGNTVDNPANVLGHQPEEVREIRSLKAGETNAVYLAHGDSFTASYHDWSFDGVSKYGKTAKAHGTNAVGGVSGLFIWDKGDGRWTFRCANKMSVLDTTVKEYTLPLYFRNATNTSEKGMLRIFLVNPNNAYYRIPRNDTYYVKRSTQLAFCRFSTLPTRWLQEDQAELTATTYTGTQWSYAQDAANYRDEFTITAAAGETVYLKTVGDRVTVTVHVVDDDFTFRTEHVCFNGTESRTLSAIFYDLFGSDDVSQVASVTTADSCQIAVTEADGDWTLTPQDTYDVAREVTVTLKDGNVILLKIVSMTGSFDESTCARTLPPTIYVQLSNLMLDNSGEPMAVRDWETGVAAQTVNAPPGYTNVARVVDAVLYRGRRYSLYAASIQPSFVANGSSGTTDGQTKCVWPNRKIACWLEDAYGRKFVSQAICVGNAGNDKLHPARFNLGLRGRVYTDDSELSVSNYLGTVLSGVGKFQGVSADAYGYYTVMVGTETTDELACANPTGADELSVYELQGAVTVDVRKTVVGTAPGTRFRFTAEYTDLDGLLVTNQFALANGETYQLAVRTGGVVRVTESASTGFVAYVRKGETGSFAEGTELQDSDVASDLVYEFENESSDVQTPTALWITDHEDAGDGYVHLAFEPLFPNGVRDFSAWLTNLRTRKAASVKSAANRADLPGATSGEAVFRAGTGDQDVAKNWVWITADVSALNANSATGLYHVIQIDNSHARYTAYEDEYIGSSVPTGTVSRTNLANGQIVYAFTNAGSSAFVELRRSMRVAGALLVAGGGAGGTGLGGGGGGGEVCELGGAALGTQAAGTVFGIEVGQGGACAQRDSIEKGDATGLYLSPGGNGGDTYLTVGDQVFRAVGGGGGGGSSFTSIASGCAGGNGGGSASLWEADVATGGVAVATNGHAGGGSKQSKSGITGGAGGGGGMAGAGADGVASTAKKVGQAGPGGEGVTNSLSGVACVYGSGGGGGGGKLSTDSDDKKTQFGQGGTNAGAGGEGAVGCDAVNGFGGGGGGGGRNVTSHYRGGRGGDGVLILVLEPVAQGNP